MAGRWKMEQNALGDLAKKTTSGTQDLGGLVKDLVAAAEPLKGKMDGPAMQAFTAFKNNVDGIASALSGSLGNIAQGQQAMATTFSTGAQQMADEAGQAQKSSDFSAAKFGKS